MSAPLPPTSAAGLLRRLARAHGGATTVEFALIGPAIILLMLGVVQIGMAMQAYNALRSVAADTARVAVVAYQSDKTPECGPPHDNDDSWIGRCAEEIAEEMPYGLDPRFTAAVKPAPARIPAVTGAREMTLTLNYTVPTVLPFVEMPPLAISFSRPIFVLD
ncbi:MAG: pilus assembly protein [Porphyrobacter sp.]|nr:pilus assembly protein [Porphyrobacter sp.]